MKNQITILLLFLFSAHLIAQDSIKTYTDAVKNQKLKLKQLIMPASLIAMGGILKTPYLQNNIQQGVKEAFPTNFHTKTDNYLQFVPLAQLLVGNAIGFQSKHGSKQMITNSILSNLAVGSIVYAGKKVAHDWRPEILRLILSHLDTRQRLLITLLYCFSNTKTIIFGMPQQVIFLQQVPPFCAWQTTSIGLAMSWQERVLV